MKIEHYEYIELLSSIADFLNEKSESGPFDFVIESDAFNGGEDFDLKANNILAFWIQLETEKFNNANPDVNKDFPLTKLCSLYKDEIRSLVRAKCPNLMVTF